MKDTDVEESRGGGGDFDPSMNGDMEDVHEKNDMERIPSFLQIYKTPIKQPKEYHAMQTLLLAYQSLGVVYGDIGTSPLYVFSSVGFSNPGERDILGIFSLIFWNLTSVALIKYVLIVLRADDHGEGGTFALYTSICRHINFQNKFSIKNTRLDSDANMKFYSERALNSKAKRFLEGRTKAQTFITVAVMLGTSMVIGDGALTPATSVLSALQGIQSVSSKITQNHVIIMAVVLLLVLFLFQRFGTSKISCAFSPIMLVWFTTNVAIGIYNIVKFYPPVFKAVSPQYIYYFFARNGKTGWEILSAVILCITGAEAMFADFGHFSKRGIQLAVSAFIYPALLITYAGQSAYLIKHPEKLSTTFYSSIPHSLFWPVFIVATMAAIVASQSLISASFSIIRQSLALGCFPRVNIIHTSNKHEGQVYSPEVNYFLMILSIAIVVGFRDGTQINNAYGVAVIWVMLITTSLLTLTMLVIWDTNSILIACFFLPFFFIEGVYMTSLLNKVPKGGWAPFAIASFLTIIMLSWTYGRSKKSRYEAEKKMTRPELSQMLSNNLISRPPGICFFCTDLVNGIPPIIRHYMQHTSSVRQIMVIVTVRILPITTVLPEERFLVGKLGLQGVYRCLVQYGYKDVPDMVGEEYVASVVAKLRDLAETMEEIRQLDSAMDEGVVFVMGRVILKSNERNCWLNRFTINTLYRFLQKNSRSAVSPLKVPTGKTLQVGMLYEI